MVLLPWLPSLDCSPLPAWASLGWLINPFSPQFLSLLRSQGTKGLKRAESCCAYAHATKRSKRTIMLTKPVAQNLGYAGHLSCMDALSRGDRLDFIQAIAAKLFSTHRVPE
eukprot:scaffold318461_cov22-Tisochrysis_lutea.AAC.1